MHTPQNGLTERSLSLFTCLCVISPEVSPRWLSTPFIQRDSFNLLMIPWPFEVLVSEFHDVTDELAPGHLPAASGFFTYDARQARSRPPGDSAVSLQRGMPQLGRVDGVVS